MFLFYLLLSTGYDVLHLPVHELCFSSHINYLKRRQFLPAEETRTACFISQRNLVFQTTELPENSGKE